MTSLPTFGTFKNNLNLHLTRETWWVWGEGCEGVGGGGGHINMQSRGWQT